MLLHLARFGGALLDFLYPPQCLLCNAGEHTSETPHLCATCLKALRAEPVPPPVDLAAALARHGLPCFVDETLAAWEYSERMQTLVQAMKYEGKRSLAGLLAAGMATRLAAASGGSHPEGVMVAVPMHARRRRERGYNQSTLLAGQLSKTWGVPKSNHLCRVRDTLQQAKLSAAERRVNVDRAFAVTRPEAFLNKNVLVIDDVVTTGSTVNACAEALKAAGALQVRVIAAARA